MKPHLKYLINPLFSTKGACQILKEARPLKISSRAIHILHLLSFIGQQNKIIDWCLAPGLHSVYTLEALNQALKQAGAEYISGLLHHSDRGSQYCCDLYVQTLTKHEIAISMTEDSKPIDNAISERINGIIKQEWLYK